MSLNDGAPCSRNPEAWGSGPGRDVETAKAGCAACGVLPACLEVTLEFEDMSGETRVGIFGGLTETERRRTRT